MTGNFDQGVAAHRQGNLEQAQRIYEAVLAAQPAHFDALHLLAVVHAQSGNPQGAIALFDRAISVRPDEPNCRFNLAKAQLALHRYADALVSLDKTLELGLRGHAVWHSRGKAMGHLGRLQESLESFTQASALDPANANLHYNCGIISKQLGRLDDAVACYDRAIEIAPQCAQYFFARGIALERAHRLEEADASYGQAIAIDPLHAGAYVNRGVVRHRQKRIEQALADYEQAIAIEPEHAHAHWCKSHALLMTRDFEAGWKLFEWRWKTPDFAHDVLATPRPLFKMPGQKQRVLVWSEQGIGDEIMFSALLPEFSRFCSGLLVRAHARVIPLLARSMPRIQFVPAGGAIAEQLYDAHIAMGSLCQYLRNDSKSFKRTSKAYLIADKARARRLRRELIGTQAVKLCGISWRSKNPHSGQERSLDLASLMGHLHMPGYRFVNLQYGDTRDEVASLSQTSGIDLLHCDEVDNYKDIDGLAALIEACDVVVSVGNTTAHLAGALGKDVRVLLPYIPTWRWMLDGDDSPWYASARVYRQEQAGDWAPVVGQVAESLKVQAHRWASS